MKRIELLHRKHLFLILLLLLLMSPALHASGFAERTVSWLKGYGLSPVMIVFLISMLPIIELRGAIPVAILFFRLPWPEAVAISVIGNMVPIPFILLFMDWFFSLLRRVPIGMRFTEWLFKRTRRKGKVIERYEALGLIVFVGIPLPGTGGWTGAFAANIFGIKFLKSLIYIFIGVLLAALAVTLLSLTGQMVVA